MNQIPRWKKDMYTAERESIKRLLVTFFKNYLTEDGLDETEYESGIGMSETDKLFALAKLYFTVQDMEEITIGNRITNHSCIIALRSVISEMINKHFKEDEQ